MQHKIMWEGGEEEEEEEKDEEEKEFPAKKIPNIRFLRNQLGTRRSRVVRGIPILLWAYRMFQNSIRIINHHTYVAVFFS